MAKKLNQTKSRPRGRSRADEISGVINSVVGLLPGVLGIIQLFRRQELTTWSEPVVTHKREYIRDAEGNLIVKKYPDNSSSYIPSGK